MTEDNVFEDFSVEEQRKQREAAILQNLSKIIPNAASWATEEMLFPLYAPTALFKYAMEIVGGPETEISASSLNNFISALGAEQYAAGTGPIEGGTYDVASFLGGGLGGGIVYEAALDKIKKSSPKVYAQLTKAFPYWVDHVHNRGPGFIKNVKGASKGTKALNFAKGFAKQIKHMVQVPGDIYYRAGANLARIGVAGTGAGFAANMLMTKPTGGTGAMSDQPFERLKYEIANNFTQSGFEVKPDELIFDPINYRVSLGPEAAARWNELGTGKELVVDSFQTINIMDRLGLLSNVTTNEEEGELRQAELDEKTRKLNEEYYAEKKRQENLPINRKIGEYLGNLFTDLGSRKLPQDIKYAAGLPLLGLKKLGETNLAQSVKGSFLAGVGLDKPVEGTDEKPYIVESGPDIIDDAKDKALNEQYKQDMMNKTLQVAPFIKEAEGNVIDKDHPLISIELNDGTVYPQPMATGGDPGQFTDSIISGMEEDVNIQDILNQSGYESMTDFDIFEEAKKKGYKEYEVAMGSIFGKAPMWAVGDVPKPNILTQNLTKNQKQILKNIEEKLGTEAEVSERIEDVIDILDIPAEGTAVGTPKQKKTIIDSPEQAEAVFYSGLEARLMDPNTPKTFNSSEDFYKFLQNKQISKKEVADNILENYIAVQKKNGQPLKTADMLKIVRQAPMRKVESVIYGNPAYGGEKAAKYPGYQEPGALPDSYRESVLYLDPKHIPQDPDSLPGNVHDFSERYVIGWSRKTDRTATLPVEKTAQGIAATVDPAMIRTLKRNQRKLKNQLKGLETSAYEKIRRGLDPDMTPPDQMSPRLIAETVDSRISFLEETDMPLVNQIRQFRSKIQDDSVKLQQMEATTKGQEITLTFADEIQSDILQQAKQLENKLRESLGSILDLPPERRLGELARQRISYSGSARSVEPEVLEFYTQNETIFRPMFNTAEEMQGFVDAFRKNKQAIEVVAKGGPAPSDDAIKAMNKAIAVEKNMLEELNVGLSEGALKQLFPNVPFKTRDEWGDALIKRDLAEAAQRLFVDKVDGAATWYAVTPANPVKNRYGQSGGTAVPVEQRTKNMKGIGTEEFYGGPESVDPKGKHYTSTVEKALKRAAKENNSEFKIIEVPNVGKVFAIKLTPEMLLPHKTHRKKGGVVYTPEIIDIFEAA